MKDRDEIIDVIEKKDRLLTQKDAALLKERQEVEATKLELAQQHTADDLLNAHQSHDAANLAQFRENAACALHDSQELAANTLKASHAANAKLLRKIEDSSVQKLREKDQVIAWFSGCYSLDDNQESS